MQIVRKEIAPLHISLDITLEPSDYTPAVKSELKKFRNQAQLKGFRKGKTPESVIKKMYGKHCRTNCLGILMKRISTTLDNLFRMKIKIISQVLTSITLWTMPSVLSWVSLLR